jgi:hypothetical protein
MLIPISGASFDADLRFTGVALRVADADLRFRNVR